MLIHHHLIVSRHRTFGSSATTPPSPSYIYQTTRRQHNLNHSYCITTYPLPITTASLYTPLPIHTASWRHIYY